MKQHITKKDLMSLSENEFLKLYRLVRPNKQIKDDRIIGFYHSKTFGFNKYLSEITIGKMIEILEDKLEHFSLEKHNDKHIGINIGSLYENGKYKPKLLYSSPKWLKSDYTDKENEEYLNSIYCDSLWIAIKEVLNESN